MCKAAPTVLPDLSSLIILYEFRARRLLVEVLKFKLIEVIGCYLIIGSNRLERMDKNKSWHSQVDCLSWVCLKFKLDC